jgi:16S rRNA (adenine(1408)-N(1))-methyltransferase
LELDGRPVVVDLGAGDGRYVYESARAEHARLYVGVDPDAGALQEYAFRASRKPARGGVDNARFVVASIEQMPPELEGIAAVVRVNFPWGGLLRALLEPEAEALAALARLAPGGRFEIVFSYDPQHDTGAFAGEPLPALDEAYIQDHLVDAYGAAGLEVTEQRRLTQDEALELPSTWGRRLLHARPREVYWLAGRVSVSR